MHNAVTTHRESTMSDFASALLQSGNELNTSTASGTARSSRPMIETVNLLDRDMMNSRNLSTVLNNIKDDGPAHSAAHNSHSHSKIMQGSAGSTSNEDVVTRLSSEALKVSGLQNKQNAAQQTKQEVLQDINSHIADDKLSIGGKRTSGYFARLHNFFMLTMFAAVIAMAVVFLQTSQRVEEIDIKIAALETSGLTEANTSSKQGFVIREELNSTVDRIDEKLRKVGSNVDIINSTIRNVSKNQMAIITKLMQPKKSNVGAAAGAITLLTDKVEQPAGDIQKPKTTESKNVAVSREVSVADTIPVTHAPMKQDTSPASLWTVNLVTLTDRNNAKQAYDQLRTAGVAPLIQEVELKGKTVYRLSVDGFATRGAAEKFVKKATENFGFKSGWIRKG